MHNVNHIHSCGYHCDKPGCIKAQRDDLVKKFIVNARKPLTDEEIDAIVRSNVTITDPNLSGAIYMSMRMVESAHGIGGGEHD